MFWALGFFGFAVPSAACVPQKPGVRQTTGTLVVVLDVVVLVDVVLLVVELLEVVLDVLVVLEVVLDVLVVLEVVLLVLVLVDVDVEVVPQLFVHASSLLALPSSQASPELTCTMPSPQIVHGFSFASVRHDCPLAGQLTC